ARDGRRVGVAGLVLVRQKPGSARGVMFLTIEDETGVANLIVWPSVFARQRRVILAAGMIACHGRVQREGAVVHVVTDRLEDLSALLRGIGQDTREGDAVGRARDIYIPDLRLGSGIKVPTRDFR
ncbi:MAG: error-prone DNA polymerase, partial [Acetobacteraceae bacterium]|nr:error-prone DNA polymerase [Acetobacteraceae bacterium]